MSPKPPTLAALRKAGYDARISCEAYAPNGFDRDAEVTMGFFRKLQEKYGI